MEPTISITPDPGAKPKKPRIPAQIEASRINGAKPKGPKSAEGKVVSSQNARKLGFAAEHNVTAANEDPSVWQNLLARYLDHYRPATPPELELVRQIAHAQCNLDRLAQIETALLDLQLVRVAGEVRRKQPGLAEPLPQALAWEAMAGRGNALALNDLHKAPRQTNPASAPDGAHLPWRHPLNRTSEALAFRRSLFPPNEPEPPRDPDPNKEVHDSSRPTSPPGLFSAGS